MTKSYTMAEIADILGAKLIGDGAVVVTHVAHPASILEPDALVLAMDKAFLPMLEQSAAKAAIVADETEIPATIRASIAVGRSRVALSTLTRLFEEVVALPVGIHPTSIIEEGAIIAPDARIGAQCFVASGAEIGAGTTLHPQVYIGPKAKIGAGGCLYSGVRIGARVEIGARVIIHFNTSIGADGFSFVTPQMGSVESAKATGEGGGASNTSLMRIASLGSVIIGDDVEIGANSSIDRGTIISTRIGNGTKIDNQVQIGHNVQVGDNCMLCGRTGIAGSVVIGNRVVLGGAVGVADHVKIGDDSVVMAMSGVAGNLPPQSLVIGVPAKPRKKMIQDMHNLARVKGLVEKIADLTSRLDALEKKEG
ncbi:MAG: UDP-3-O-(3-hydroxymyristoyl)glucosamine N-acyltransferase [Bdellovibrionales bacterium]|jgi:UDP-3-O-[3-hydroxymyristoyl] glucosamine N-acyltransferase